MIDTQSNFYKLGSFLACPNEDLTALENAVNDKSHISLQKKLASVLSSLLSSFEETKNSPAQFHLAKVASTKFEVWNDFCEDTILNCTDVLQRNSISPKQFAKYAANIPHMALTAASTPAMVGLRMAGLGIPLVGALGGGLTWLAEKELSEDDYKTELLKSQMKEYRRLALSIEKELKDIYGYESPEEKEERKTLEDNAKALAKSELERENKI